MEILNSVNISVANKTNEENIQAIKGWMSNTTETVNFYMTQMMDKIESLENQIKELKGE